MAAVPNADSVSSQPKTLPMKYKAMHYAIVQFIATNEIFDEHMKVRLYNSLPIHESPERQTDYYTQLVDFKSVEKELIKPMMKKKKDEERAAAKAEEKEAKKAAKKAEKDANANTKTPKPSTKATKKKKEEQAVVEVVPELNALEIIVPSNIDEMTEEAYEEPPSAAPSTPVMPKKTKTQPSEKPKKPKVSKKSEKIDPIPISAPLASNASSSSETKEYFMLRKDDVRYWTQDESLQNGPVFSSITDEDGDPNASNIQVGVLKNGELILKKNKKIVPSKPKKKC
jgi:hypothetical protein